MKKKQKISSKSNINANELWSVAWTYIRTVVDTIREPFLILDKNLKVLSANKTFYAFFHVIQEETEGNLVYKLGNGQWNIPKLKILLEDILPKHTHFEDFKVEHDFLSIGHKIMMLNARQIHTPGEQKAIMLLAMEDITKQVLLGDKLKKITKEQTIEVAKKMAQLEIRVKELERKNKIMLSQSIKILELKAEIEKSKKRNNSRQK